MVRAKFKVVGKLAVDGGVNVTLTPVIGGSSENDEFYRLTPGGKLELSTINPDAADQFVLGEEYYVDLTKV